MLIFTLFFVFLVGCTTQDKQKYTELKESSVALSDSTLTEIHKAYRFRGLALYSDGNVYPSSKEGCGASVYWTVWGDLNERSSNNLSALHEGVHLKVIEKSFKHYVEVDKKQDDFKEKSLILLEDILLMIPQASLSNKKVLLELHGVHTDKGLSVLARGAQSSIFKESIVKSKDLVFVATKANMESLKKYSSDEIKVYLTILSEVESQDISGNLKIITQARRLFSEDAHIVHASKNHLLEVCRDLSFNVVMDSKHADEKEFNKSINKSRLIELLPLDADFSFSKLKKQSSLWVKKQYLRRDGKVLKFSISKDYSKNNLIRAKGELPTETSNDKPTEPLSQPILELF